VPFLLFTGSSESIDVVFSKSLVVKVPSQVTAIIQEMHLVLLHIICEEIDEILES
jgi:phosphoheptose isomerase